MSVFIRYNCGDISSHFNFNFDYFVKCVTVLHTTDHFERVALTTVKAP
jgi:hypothetical protein